MFGIEILDVIIGLAFIYLLCSLAASALSEAIVRFFDIRAKNLEKELVKMLNEDLKVKLYNHPFIKAVTRDLKWIERRVFKRSERPSYIDTKFFSMALTDILRREGKDLNRNAGDKDRNTAFEDVTNGITKLKNPTVSNENQGSETKTPPPVSALESILDLFAMEIHRSRDKIAAFRGKIENWFDTTMKEMSIWYKRKSRVYIFFIAILLCAGLNIDTIMITKYLYQNDAVRTQLVESAIKYAEENPAESPTEAQVPPREAPEAVSPQPENKIEPAKDAVSSDPKAEPENKPPDNPTPPEKKEDPLQIATKLQADLQELGLPIGWHCDAKQKDDIQGEPHGWAEWIVKVLGLLISALAISMGAPFWLDMLRKMIAFRKEISPAKKEEKSDAK